MEGFDTYGLFAMLDDAGVPEFEEVKPHVAEEVVEAVKDVR